MNRFFFILLFVLVAVIGWCGGSIHTANNVFSHTDTIYIEKTDTIKITEVTERWRTYTHSDTILLTDSFFIINPADSSYSATASVILPIEQSNYSDTIDGLGYDAYVSGYNAKLDSINLFHTYTEQIIEPTKEPSRWGFGVQVGYGFSAKGVVPYMGVGIQYRLF